MTIHALSRSRNGQKSAEWGPLIWWWLMSMGFYASHYLARGTQVQLTYVKKFVRLIELYLVLLYCMYCRASLNDFYFLNSMRYRVLEKADLNPYQWILWLHRCVNEKLKKPAFPASRTWIAMEATELPYWERGEVSPQFLNVFWTAMYLIALNYPVSIEDERRKTIRSAAKEFLPLAAELIPFSLACETIGGNYKLADPDFESRDALFNAIYLWDGASKEFGSARRGTVEEVAAWFESKFRVPDSGTKNSEILKSESV